MIVDADAHVVETEHTWDFLDASEKVPAATFQLRRQLQHAVLVRRGKIGRVPPADVDRTGT